MTTTQLFDALAIRIDGKRAWEGATSILWHLTDDDEHFRMELSNGALVHFPTQRLEPTDLVVSLTRTQLLTMMAGGGTDGVQMVGDAGAFATIAAFADNPEPSFPIVTP